MPGDSSTDNGVVMLDALNYWRKTGLGGHKIKAFMAVDWNNLTEVFQAIQLFGNVFLGVALPLSVQTADSWTVSDGGIYAPAGVVGGWGGHACPLMAASPQTMTCITWGERLKMSHNFLSDYAEECWVCLSTDWFSAAGNAPSQLNLAQLEADLALLESKKNLWAGKVRR